MLDKLRQLGQLVTAAHNAYLGSLGTSEQPLILLLDDIITLADEIKGVAQVAQALREVGARTP